MATETHSPKGVILTYFGATATTAGPETTNTVAPGDVCPELTTSLVKKRSDSTLKCMWWARSSNSTASSRVHTTLVIDGDEILGPRRGRTGFEASGAVDQGTPGARLDVEGLAAGSYTIAVHFWVTAGTGKLEGIDRGLYIEEIVMP